MESLLVTYGYMGILVGAILEGEATVILGGILAHQGILEIRSLIFVALVGTLAGDQFFYHLARWKGYEWACRSSRFRKNFPRASYLMHRHAFWIILMSRFLYGLRIMIPTCCGVMRISAWRYSLLNLISAFLWTPLMAYLGYGFGQGVQALIQEEWRSLPFLLLGILLTAVLILWFFGWYGMREGLIVCRFKSPYSLFPNAETTAPAVALAHRAAERERDETPLYVRCR